MTENMIWHLGDLYDGPEDPKLQSDGQWCMEESMRFSRSYVGQVAGLSPEEMFKALNLLEGIEETCRKIASFAYLYFVTRTQEPEAGRVWRAAQELESAVHRKTLFFSVEWSQLAEARALSLLDHVAVRPYRHHLERLRAYGPYRLSAPEEQILEALSLTGQKAWVDLFDKVLASTRFGAQGRTLASVLADLYHSVRETRRRAALELSEGIEQVLPVLTHICNTLTLDKSLRDDLRSYPHWLRDMNLHNEASDEQVEALDHAVGSRYDMVHDYYVMKTKILRYSELYDYDRYAPLPGRSSGAFTWEEASDTVLVAFDGFSPELARVASRFFDEKWIHAAAAPGKAGGAFSHPTVPSCHPYICLHFNGTSRDVMTLAHELGHGFHQYLCRSQGLFNSKVPFTLAETASVFGEMLVFESLLQKAGSPDERLGLLCGKIEEIFSTIFRQIALHRFEAALHNQRRIHGELSSKRLSDLWMSTQEEMYGQSLRLEDHYRIWWAYIPHFIRAPGYVYAYAFAELAALSLFRAYQRDPKGFVPLYMDLLRSGSSASPAELMKPFGMDLADPAFFRQGLSIVEEMLQEARRSTDDTSYLP